MLTALDLPDELMRDIKIRAINEHKKLTEMIAELLQKGLAVDRHRRGKLPKPVKLRRAQSPPRKSKTAINWDHDSR
jgi:hypothetical protein